ncbi:MAG: TRZ/ATZ family hydrolase [Gammaproteobacteria bacterium]|nr:TRZ/ATZ family hydrolase [Gammaproteobacteria bacterium]
MKLVDSLIHGRWIVPVVPHGQILENHSIVINSSKIIEIIPTNEVIGRYQAHHETNLKEHLVLPGLINAHTHAAMSLLRGIADDLPLKSWLEKHIWPLEGQFVGEEFVRDGTLLAVSEMILSGTTCYADMYFYPGNSAEVISEAGIRARIGLIISDFTNNYCTNVDEYFTKGLEFVDNYKHHPLISTQFAPHAPYTVSDAPLNRIQVLSTELAIPIQMHIHETVSEVSDAVEATGKRPLQRLEDLGLLTPDLQAVHMTELNAEEIEKLSANGVHIIHCPESNMKLASGTCPVDLLLGSGVNVALGTDGAASNNDLDMLGEMKSAALLGKLAAKDATAVSAMTVLEMATINGARALGMDKEIGSLERGKQADIIAVDMSGIEQQPMYNPISQLVYTSDRTQVTNLWVAGKHLMKDRQLTTLNLSSILENTQEWQQKLKQQDNL